MSAQFYCDTKACGECAGCKEAALLEALAVAERANMHNPGCQVCEALAIMSEPVKSAVMSALAGTIGRDKLVTILTQSGYDVGRRALDRHRREGHTQ